MATLKDIARDSGFSVSVVSRALNPHPDQQVAAETKRKIEESMRKLNYRRNHTASLLARGRSIAIGVFLPRYRDVLIAELVFGISAAAAEYDFPCNCYFGMSENDYLHFFDQVNDAGSSGILTYHFGDNSTDNRLSEAFKRYRKSGGNVILLNTPPNEEFRETTLNINNIVGGKLAANHLIECGCKSFYCFSPKSYSYMQNARCNGFAGELAKNGLSSGQYWVNFNGFQEYDNGLLTQYIAQLPQDRKVGIFATNDYLALSIMRVIHNSGMGKEIGKRIQIVGFDDMPGASFATPPLTSISQPFYQLGYISMARLIAMITGETLPEPELPESELIIRASSSPEK